MAFLPRPKANVLPASGAAAAAAAAVGGSVSQDAQAVLRPAVEARSALAPGVGPGSSDSPGDRHDKTNEDDTAAREGRGSQKRHLAPVAKSALAPVPKVTLKRPAEEAAVPKSLLTAPAEPAEDIEEDDPLMAVALSAQRSGAFQASSPAPTPAAAPIGGPKARLPSKLPRPLPKPSGVAKKQPAETAEELVSKRPKIADPGDRPSGKLPRPGFAGSGPTQPPAAKNAAVLPGRKQEDGKTQVLLSDLPPDWRSQDVQELCEQYGELQAVKSPGKGSFSVLYTTTTGAAKATKALNGLQMPSASGFCTLKCTVEIDLVDAPAAPEASEPVEGRRRRSRWSDDTGTSGQESTQQSPPTPSAASTAKVAPAPEPTAASPAPPAKPAQWPNDSLAQPAQSPLGAVPPMASVSTAHPASSVASAPAAPAANVGATPSSASADSKQEGVATLSSQKAPEKADEAKGKTAAEQGNAADEVAPWQRLRKTARGTASGGGATSSTAPPPKQTDKASLERKVASRLSCLGSWKSDERTQKKLVKLTSHIVNKVFGEGLEGAHERVPGIFKTLTGALGAERAQEFGAWLVELAEELHEAPSAPAKPARPAPQEVNAASGSVSDPAVGQAATKPAADVTSQAGAAVQPQGTLDPKSVDVAPASQQQDALGTTSDGSSDVKNDKRQSVSGALEDNFGRLKSDQGSGAGASDNWDSWDTWDTWEEQEAAPAAPKAQPQPAVTAPKAKFVPAPKLAPKAPPPGVVLLPTPKVAERAAPYPPKAAPASAAGEDQAASPAPPAQPSSWDGASWDSWGGLGSWDAPLQAGDAAQGERSDETAPMGSADAAQESGLVASEADPRPKAARPAIKASAPQLKASFQAFLSKRVMAPKVSAPKPDGGLDTTLEPPTKMPRMVESPLEPQLFAPSSTLPTTAPDQPPHVAACGSAPQVGAPGIAPQQARPPRPSMRGSVRAFKSATFDLKDLRAAVVARPPGPNGAEGMQLNPAEGAASLPSDGQASSPPFNVGATAFPVGGGMGIRPPFNPDVGGKAATNEPSAPSGEGKGFRPPFSPGDAHAPAGEAIGWPHNEGKGKSSADEAVWPPADGTGINQAGNMASSPGDGQGIGFAGEVAWSPGGGKGGGIGLRPQFGPVHGGKGDAAHTLSDGKGFVPQSDGKGFGPPSDGKGYVPFGDGKGCGPLGEGKGFEPLSDGTGLWPSGDGKGIGLQVDGKGFLQPSVGKGTGSPTDGKGLWPSSDGKGYSCGGAPAAETSSEGPKGGAMMSGPPFGSPGYGKGSTPPFDLRGAAASPEADVAAAAAGATVPDPFAACGRGIRPSFHPPAGPRPAAGEIGGFAGNIRGIRPQLNFNSGTASTLASGNQGIRPPQVPTEQPQDQAAASPKPGAAELDQARPPLARGAGDMLQQELHRFDNFVKELGGGADSQAQRPGGGSLDGAGRAQHPGARGVSSADVDTHLQALLSQQREQQQPQQFGSSGLDQLQAQRQMMARLAMQQQLQRGGDPAMLAARARAEIEALWTESRVTLNPATEAESKADAEAQAKANAQEMAYIHAQAQVQSRSTAQAQLKQQQLLSLVQQQRALHQQLAQIQLVQRLTAARQATLPPQMLLQFAAVQSQMLALQKLIEQVQASPDAGDEEAQAQMLQKYRLQQAQAAAQQVAPPQELAQQPAQQVKEAQQAYLEKQAQQPHQEPDVTKKEVKDDQQLLTESLLKALDMAHPKK